MRKLVIWIIAGILLFVGCSGKTNPVAPDVNSNSPSGSPGTLDNLPVLGLTTSNDGSFNAVGLMGGYELKIDPVNVKAELVSKRLPSLGESWIVNGIKYFTIAPCPTCLRIISVALSADGNLVLTFDIKHPFPPGDPLLPPTGKNRLDLDLFDVALVVRPTNTTPATYTLTGASAYTGVLTNNSGYTVELKNVVNDPAALPYELVIDDSTGSTSTFNEFSMGAEKTFDVNFNLAGLTGMSFDLFLTFGYGNSAKKLQRLTPTYFNPEFNRKSAWKVQAIPPEGVNPPTVGNTWDDNNTTTPYAVTVKVWDWQQGVTTIANPVVNPGDIAFASDVASVSAEVPGMNTTLPSVTTPTSGTGTPVDPLIFTVPFPNQNGLDEGTYIGLVKVLDSRVPGPIPPTGTIDYLIDNQGGGVLQPTVIPEFATYQTFVATVVIGNLPPTCDLQLNTQSAGGGETVIANPGTSADPEGLIASYEYDKDYDGTTFTADITQLSGQPGFGTPVNIQLPCNTTGSPLIVKIALRVCDGGGPPGMCTVCSKDVTIATKVGNPGDVTATLNRGESGANARLITSVNLDWPDNPCAVEYSIQRAANGWTGTGYAQVGVSATSSYKYLLTGNDWDEDYRFRVIARAVTGGNPSSDSDPSQEVFVWFLSNMGTTASPSNAMIPTAESGSQLYFSSSSGGGPTVDSYGSTAWGPFCWGQPNVSEWAVIRSPQAVPDLTGQTTAWCEFYYNRVINNWTSTTLGMTLGTLSAVPSSSSPTLNDYNSANTVYGTGYPYNATNVEGLNVEFGETNQSGWRYPASSGPTYCAYYMNDLLDGTGSRDWVALGLANGSVDNGTGITVWGCYDAMAVVVY